MIGEIKQKEMVNDWWNKTKQKEMVNDWWNKTKGDDNDTHL